MPKYTTEQRTSMRLEAVILERPADVAAAAALLAAVPEGASANVFARARREAASVCSALTPHVLALLETLARADLQGLANLCGVPAQAQPLPGPAFAPQPASPPTMPQDAPAQADSPELASDVESLARRSRERLATALDIGDSRGAATLARTTKILTELPVKADTESPLDWSRLTPAELEALEALCDVARGNRPAHGATGATATWLARIGEHGPVAVWREALAKGENLG